MTPLTILLAASIVLQGPVSSYAPLQMNHAIANRQARRAVPTLPKNLPPVDGYIAMAEREMIGRIVFIRFWGEGPWQAFLVTDCASTSDRQSKKDKRSTWEWMKQEGITGEVDFETAEELGKTWGGIPAEIIVPPEDTVILPARIGGHIPDLKGVFTIVSLAGFEIYLPKDS
jgi:hypothetical protein